MLQHINYSVIIPVYNSEKTIARCLNSIAAQNREDVQIIVINDGSTDSSDSIIREFADRYPQILYISQENAGVSRARNTGLDAAKGTYITFVDSDDYVREDYFQVLDQHNDCELLAFCHHVLGADDSHLLPLFSELQKLSSPQRLELLLNSRRIMSPWDKRFQRRIIESHHLRFLDGLSVGEDFNFCMAYTVHCSDIQIESEQIICNDVTGENSLSRKYRPHLDLQMLDVFTHIGRTIRNSPQPDELKARLLAAADYLFIKNTFSCISEEFKQKKLSFWKDRKQIADICNTFRQPLSDRRVNLIHRALRLALTWKLDYPFYLVSYWVKGRKYAH